MAAHCLWLASAAFQPSVQSLLPDPRISTPHTVTTVNYGKYWSVDARTGSVSTEANTYYVFKPATQSAGAAPVIVEYHGGGFTGGSASPKLSARIESFLSNGIAFASMDYRLVATKYFYGNQTNWREEEFIHAAPDGRLTLDTTGKVASDYKVRVGRQEFNTKCSFDAAAGFSDLLGRAEAFGIDVHRVGLTGGSAGGGEIHYLSWVWPALDRNFERYTVTSMVYTMAQYAMRDKPQDRTVAFGAAWFPLSDWFDAQWQA